MKKKLILVAGARPNFMKIAPLMHKLADHPTIEPVLVHTGQHYDEKMSSLFFKQLNIPEPDINLEVGSATHAVQTARIMEHFEKVCLDVKPDMVMVVGDVNSTVACTLVPSKMDTKTAHYEAGLRSRDRSMPEEINRMATDAICDYFFTTSHDADENLVAEGKDPKTIFFVGNLMIDTLLACFDRLPGIDLQLPVINNGCIIDFKENYQPKEYGVITLHRPSNVDNVQILKNISDLIGQLSNRIPLIFPVHPRTLKNLQDFGLLEEVMHNDNLLLTKTVGYLEFIKLVNSTKFVLTDSGGIQEETTIMDVPCLTIRPNTERPITITDGTNTLVSLEQVEQEVANVLDGKGKSGRKPQLWDGKTAERIVDVLPEIMN